MKKFFKHSAVQGVLVIIAMFAVFGVVVFLENNDFHSAKNMEAINKAKAICAARGGEHIANPHGALAFLGKINGQGCSLDYARWEEYKAEWRAKNAALREHKK